MTPGLKITQLVSKLGTSKWQRMKQQQQQDPPVQPQQAEEEAEGRKKKMKDFDDAASVGNYIAPRPAQYALRCIGDF